MRNEAYAKDESRKAVRLYKKSIHFKHHFCPIPDVRDIYLRLDLANLYLHLNESRKALDILKECLSFAKSVDNVAVVILTLNKLAEVEVLFKDYSNAYDHYSEALTLANVSLDKVKHQTNKLTYIRKMSLISVKGLAQIHSLQNRHGRSQAFYERALRWGNRFYKKMIQSFKI